MMVARHMVSPFRRSSILAALLLALPLATTRGSDTARTAWQLFVQNIPPRVSSQVLAVLGFDGNTQPEIWRFLVPNPEEPGNILEYRVHDGVLLEPVPLPASEVPGDLLDRPLPANALTVDSHDVARVIDDAVILEGVQFSRLDYQLCWRSEGPEPIWMATLVGETGETLGHMFVSSVSGEVTHRAFYHDFPRLPAAAASTREQPEETGAGENRRPAMEVSGSPSSGIVSDSRPAPTLFRRNPGKPRHRSFLPEIFDRTPDPGVSDTETTEAEESRRRRLLPPFLRRR